MYSSYDDPDFRPAPGARERTQLRFLRVRAEMMRQELEAVEREITELESLPYVLDTPLPV